MQWHSLASIYKSVWSHGRKGKEFYMASSVKSDSFSKTSVKMSHRRVKLETNHSLVFSKFDIQTQIFSTNCIVEGSVYFAGLQFKLFSSGRAPVVTWLWTTICGTKSHNLITQKIFLCCNINCTMCMWSGWHCTGFSHSVHGTIRKKWTKKQQNKDRNKEVKSGITQLFSNINPLKGEGKN